MYVIKHHEKNLYFRKNENDENDFQLVGNLNKATLFDCLTSASNICIHILPKFSINSFKVYRVHIKLTKPNSLVE